MSTVIPKKRLASGLTVTQKVFVRSRNGGATKVVSEHYLRDDIPCYSKACTRCPEIVKPDANNQYPNFVLSDSPVYAEKYGHHYVVLDTNIVLLAIDLLENKDAFCDVIVPQTVLEEVRNRSFPIYTRLIALCKSDEKRFAVFHMDSRKVIFSAGP